MEVLQSIQFGLKYGQLLLKLGVFPQLLLQVGVFLLYLLQFVVQHDLYLGKVFYAQVLGQERNVVRVVAVVSLQE